MSRNQSFRRWIALLSIGLFAALLAAGCGGGGGKSPASKPAPKPPASLEAMNRDLTGLLGMIDQKVQKARKPAGDIGMTPQTGSAGTAAKSPKSTAPGTSKTSSAGASQGSSTKKSVSGSTNQNSISGMGRTGGSGGGSTKTGGQSPGQPAAKPGQTQKPKNPWQPEEKLVEKLNKDWNRLEPDASSHGFSPADSERLEASLNQLTTAVLSRDLTQAEHQANLLYGEVTELSARFPGTNPAEIGRLRFHLRESRRLAQLGDWAQASTQAADGVTAWRSLSPQLKDSPSTALQQMNHAITDVENSIREQNEAITTLKTGIALADLDQLEKHLKAKTGLTGG
ncbi:MAG: hypothetical protein ACM3QZ_11700 [Solirubrobacterales bacterium]